MSKRIIRNRRARYGGMSVLLTALLITVVVLFNSLFTTLAERYSWYASLNRTPEYPVTESCYTLLGTVLDGTEEKVEIIFCDTEKNLQADATMRYVYENAKDISQRFSDKVSISCHNIWLNPKSVEQYTYVRSSTIVDTTVEDETDAENAEEGSDNEGAAAEDSTEDELVKVALKSTNVIIASGDYHRVYDLTEFFVFENGDTSKLWAYNGEKKLASGILHAVDQDGAVVGMTNNHGEVFYDYELLYLLDDAGYTIQYFNLYSDPIPENCNLIITYNPNSDLTVKDDNSETSEIEILDAFLDIPGNAYLVFVENGTPELPNLEEFLAGWGVETMSAQKGDYSYRYTMQDSTQSLTSDGYTIYGQAANGTAGEKWISGMEGKAVFPNATALRPANGFVNNNDGSYTKNNRTVYSLYTASESAVAWAGGNPAPGGSSAMLFALTEQTNEGEKSSFVGVCASSDMLTEQFLQSAVHGNTDLMMRIFASFGKSNLPTGLTIKPFNSTTISSVTTSQMWTWTVLMALTPAVVITVVAWVVMAKRRRR